MRMRDMISLMKAKSGGLRGYAVGGSVPAYWPNWENENRSELRRGARPPRYWPNLEGQTSPRATVAAPPAPPAAPTKIEGGLIRPKALGGAQTPDGVRPPRGLIGGAARFAARGALPAYVGVRTALEAGKEGTTEGDVQVGDEIMAADPIQRGIRALLGEDSRLAEARRAITGGMVTAGRRAANIAGGLFGADSAGDAAINAAREAAGVAPVSFERSSPPAANFVDSANDDREKLGIDRVPGNFGLRGPSERGVPGAPGIIRRDEPGKSPLYTDGSSGGRVSTIQTSDIAPKQAAQLTAAIQARLASEDPADREFARQLAVTPEHRAMIAQADTRARMSPQEKILRDQVASQENIARMQLLGQQGLRDAQIARLMYDMQKGERDFAVGERDKAFQREGELAKEARTVIGELIPGKDDDPSVSGMRSAFVQFVQATRPEVNGKSLFTLPRAQLQQQMQDLWPRFQMQMARNASVASSGFTSNTEYGGIRGYDPPVRIDETSVRDVTRGTTVPAYLRNKIVPGYEDKVVVTRSGARIPISEYVRNAEQRAALERELGIRGR